MAMPKDPHGLFKKTQRLCLGGCGKLFWSSSKGNRICDGCAATNRTRGRIYKNPAKGGSR